MKHVDPITGIDAYKQHLISSFITIFMHKPYIDEMRNVARALRNNENILEWKDIESFCSTFLPFRFTPTSEKYVQEYQFPESLMEFMQLCTFLESRTDQFARFDTMEKITDKEAIADHLEKLLAVLPAQQEFISWISAIRKK